MKTILFNAVVDDSMSALADGELRGEEFAQVLAACEKDQTLLVTWHSYHLIGDVLRSPDLLAPHIASPFLTRLQSRLAQETIQPAAQPSDFSKMLITLPVETPVAANDSIFRWKLMAGMASMAAVAMMVWTLALPIVSTGPQMAQSAAPTDSVLVASPQGTIVRDARLQELLAAHRQVGGNSALQMPSGFLRNATFEISLSASNARR